MRGRAIFLDRDGVVTAETGDYITRPEDLQMEAGAAEAIARLCAAGWRVFLFTNQAGVGRGKLTLETLHAIHAHLMAQVEAEGGTFSGIYFCPHHPDAGCDCRKPKPGLLLQAAAEHGLDLRECVVLGDSPRDIQAGDSVGCETGLVLSGHTGVFTAETFPVPLPQRVFANLTEAADTFCAPSEE